MMNVDAFGSVNDGISCQSMMALIAWRPVRDQLSMEESAFSIEESLKNLHFLSKNLHFEIEKNLVRP